MPIIDISVKTLDTLIGKKVDSATIQEALFRFGMEIDSVKGDTLKIEITPDRVDMMTPEGIARALRAYLGIQPGIPPYAIKKSNAVVYVNSNLKGIREYSACALVKNLKWTHTMIKETMSAHGKIDQTYGRKRKKIGLGVYPLDNIAFPVRYYGEKQDKIRFVPLGSTAPMTAEEIKKKHPKGKENADITKGWELFPIFKDKKGKIMSLIPFINSR